MDLDHERRLAEVESRAKSNSRRIDELTKSTEALNRLATSLEVMATKQDAMADTLSHLDGKVEALEAKPARRWDGLVDKLLLTAAAAIAGFILAQLGIF